VDRADFLTHLGERFPEVLARIDKYQAGLLHCEVGAFLSTVEEALDSGREWYVEQALRFVHESLGQADPELLNALEVSFLEGLALGEHTAERRRILRDRAPRSLLERIREVHEFWK
jgi:hypothetical protein